MGSGQPGTSRVGTALGGKEWTAVVSDEPTSEANLNDVVQVQGVQTQCVVRCRFGRIGCCFRQRDGCNGL